MTIDEAIADAEEYAKDLERQSEQYPAIAEELKTLAANRRQLVKWLCELKVLRKIVENE